MKCLTCNECSDKEICARVNGFRKAPYPLVRYFKKLCEEPETLNYIKEIKIRKDILEVDRDLFEAECNKLMKLIEKTKCCENCKHEHNFDYCKENNCNNLDKWELADYSC